MLAAGTALYAAGQSSHPGAAEAGDAQATIDLTFSGVAAYGAVSQAQALTAAPQPRTIASELQVAPAPSVTTRVETLLRVEASRAATDSSLDPMPPAAPAPPAPTPEPGPACDRSVSAIYCVYTVQAGDTLSKIAREFGLKGTAGVAPWELVVDSNKPDIISAEDYIQAGQKLRIPLSNGVVHVVLTGDSLGDLASSYGVTSAAIVAAPGNSIGAGAGLTIGQEVLIPDPARIPAPVTGTAVTPSTATPEPSGTPEPSATPEPLAESTAIPPAIAAQGSATAVATASAQATSTPRRTQTPGRGTPTPTPAPSRSAAGFIWPAAGPISSYFGPSHPLGIDIDLFNNPNAPIVAAAAGTVTFAGGNTCCSYGLYVIVDHGNGYSTLYAHLSSISVSSGQRVPQGHFLGFGGRTGYATGNHLHFEVRYNDAIVNPMSVLP